MLPEKWYPKPCEDNFKKLAEKDPTKLIEWIRTGNLRGTILTYALEALWRVKGDRSEVIKVAIEHTYHNEPLVREGAIYAFDYDSDWKHIQAEHITDRLKDMSISDISDGVKECAKEALEEFAYVKEVENDGRK